MLISNYEFWDNSLLFPDRHTYSITKGFRWLSQFSLVSISVRSNFIIRLVYLEGIKELVEDSNKLIQGRTNTRPTSEVAAMFIIAAGL